MCAAWSREDDNEAGGKRPIYTDAVGLAEVNPLCFHQPRGEEGALWSAFWVCCDGMFDCHRVCGSTGSAVTVLSVREQFHQAIGEGAMRGSRSMPRSRTRH